MSPQPASRCAATGGRPPTSKCSSPPSDTQKCESPHLSGPEPGSAVTTTTVPAGSSSASIPAAAPAAPSRSASFPVRPGRIASAGSAPAALAPAGLPASWAGIGERRGEGDRHSAGSRLSALGRHHTTVDRPLATYRSNWSSTSRGRELRQQSQPAGGHTRESPGTPNGDALRPGHARPPTGHAPHGMTDRGLPGASGGPHVLRGAERIIGCLRSKNSGSSTVSWFISSMVACSSRGTSLRSPSRASASEVKYKTMV
jgi:hypothetical protein